MININISGPTPQDIAATFKEAVAASGIEGRGGTITFTATLGDGSCIAIFCINIWRVLWLSCDEDIEEALGQIKDAVAEIVRDVKKELR